MKPCDCPFAAIDEVLEEIANQTRYILVDFHAEATGEKQTLGRYLDGRVTAVLGTHTHVTTADEMILPKKLHTNLTLACVVPTKASWDARSATSSKLPPP